MRTSFFSEVTSSFRRLLVLAKVEKYIHVSNQWLLVNSGKALEQAHRVTQKVQQIELEKYLNTGKEWLLETPDRALNHAYDAALILKKIEDKHFAGNPITAISNYSDGVSTYFQLVSKRYLLLIQIRLLEFQTSHAIMDVQSFNQQLLENNLENNDEASSILDKLKFIDEVLIRYEDQPAKSSISINHSDFVTEAAIGIPELEIRNQSAQQWKLLEIFQLSFGKGNQSASSQATTIVEMPSQTLQERSRSVGNFATQLGLASLLFAGGLAIGGAVSWFLLSTPDQTNDGSKPQNSTKVHPDRTQAETTNSQVAVQLSPPETLPTESNAAVVRPGGATKPATDSHRASEVVQGDRASNQKRKTHGISSPSAPETVPLERRTPAHSQTSQPSPQPAAVVPPSLTQQRQLTQVDLKGRSAWELTVMRNEIYARHGRQFYEPELQRHFEDQRWYQPRYEPEKFPVSLLSETEMYNAVLIRNYQDTHALWQP